MAGQLEVARSWMYTAIEGHGAAANREQPVAVIWHFTQILSIALKIIHLLSDTFQNAL
jgi:hypothetical protein